MSEPEEPGKLKIDLAALGLPPKITVDGLGAVQVDVISGAFGQWVDAWVRQPRGDSGALVRELVVAHATTAAEPPSRLDQTRLDALTAAEVDQAAAAILEATAWHFRPKYISSGTGAQRKVRKRGAQEPYDLSAREGETDADRLLRVLSDWRQDRRDLNWLLSAPSRTATAALLQTHGPQSPFQRIIDQQKAINHVLATDIGSSILRTPTLHLAIADAARRQQEQILRLGSADHVLAGSRAQAHSLFEAIKASNMSNIAALTRYPDIGASLAKLTIGPSILDATTREALTSLSSRLRPFDVAWARQPEWLRLANRQFDLRIPGATLAAIAALNPAVAGLNVQRLTAFPIGFQLAAGLGLREAAPQGAVADLLQFYDELPSDEAPAFEATLETAILIDEAEDAVRILEHLERFLAWAIAAALNEVDILKRQGYVGLIVLACTLFGAWNDLTDEAATKAQMAGVEQRVVKLGDEITALRREVLDQRHDRADERRFIRYVHQRAPLRAEPHGKAAVIRYVYSDQELRLIDERADWVLVEAYDHHANGAVTGWISRSRLRIDPKL